MSTLTLEQKQTLYRDGYIVLKNAVSQHLVDAARGSIENPEEGVYAGSTPVMTDLVNASSVTPVLHEAMGYFDPPITCQVGVNRVRQPGEHFNNLGYREKDQPYYAAESHMDGLCTIRVPQERQDGTPEEIYSRYVASGWSETPFTITFGCRFLLRRRKMMFLRDSVPFSLRVPECGM
jgi:hypothetical protein